MKGSQMKKTLWIILSLFFATGCSDYVVAPESAPQTEHDKRIKAQHNALMEQQQAALDNYRY